MLGFFGAGGGALIAAFLFALIVSVITGGIAFSLYLLYKKRIRIGSILLLFSVLAPITIYVILLSSNDNRKQSISEISLSFNSENNSYVLLVDGGVAKEKICEGEDVKFTFNYDNSEISGSASRVRVDFRELNGYKLNIRIRGINETRVMENYLKETFSKYREIKPHEIQNGNITLTLGSSKYGDYFIDFIEK